MEKFVLVRRPFLCIGLLILFGNVIPGRALAQGENNQSVARLWNEALLNGIRNDFARPTVHARNLFHTSIAFYDLWSVHDEEATPFLLGKTVRGFHCPFEGVSMPGDINEYRNEAISYAAYRLIRHRFRRAPGRESTYAGIDQLMEDLGYELTKESTDYSGGDPAALGNYMAQCLIDFGLQDGSNEEDNYENQFYEPVNESMQPTVSGTQGINNPNRWQPLNFVTFEDQAGFESRDRSPDFLSPEWGQVTPFALRGKDRSVYFRRGEEYWVYYDPGEPALLTGTGTGEPDEYQWGHSLVSIWSSHLNPEDGVMWDISPNSIGNISDYPITIAGLREFYDRYEGGDPSPGHDVNPSTGQPYPSQVVPRGDYTRVLAEFWADGPDSETPPGHWFTILNYVNDHPDLVKKFRGEGPTLDNLEWDIKAYFALGGAMHDAAIAAWSIKGWYDYVRPISAIRHMAERGQSTNRALGSYSPDGIPLENNLIEVVEPGDPLAGSTNQNAGKIKLWAWKGTGILEDGENETAGVGWILAEDWVPYQRPTFVTPPFAGYVSGHSTFSRAAAEVLTLLTGDEYFPGGVGEFLAEKDTFLFFEKGPSVDITLQWATYRDASDQTSLSRIWGGIHPPVDDIPGRLIGEKVGIEAFHFAERYFAGDLITSVGEEIQKQAEIEIFPNPVSSDYLNIRLPSSRVESIGLTIYKLNGQKLLEDRLSTGGAIHLDMTDYEPGTYIIGIETDQSMFWEKVIILD